MIALETAADIPACPRKFESILSPSFLGFSCRQRIGILADLFYRSDRVSPFVVSRVFRLRCVRVCGLYRLPGTRQPSEDIRTILARRRGVSRLQLSVNSPAAARVRLQRSSNDDGYSLAIDGRSRMNECT